MQTPESDEETCSRKKEFFGIPMVCRDGKYNNHDEHGNYTLVCSGGYIDGQPAIQYEDGHTENWRKGWPENDNPELPAITSEYGCREEYWVRHHFIRLLKFVCEVRDDD